MQSERCDVLLTALTMNGMSAVYHWRLPPETVRHRLPHCLRVQPFDGSAVCSSAVSDASGSTISSYEPRFCWISRVKFANLRCWAEWRIWRWFFSASCAFGAGARWVLSYQHARMTTQRRRARFPPACWFAEFFAYRRSGDWQHAQLGSLQYFWPSAVACRISTRLPCCQVWFNTPYEVAPATAIVQADALFRLNGFAAPGRQPDHLLVARPVAVRASFPSLVWEK